MRLLPVVLLLAVAGRALPIQDKLDLLADRLMAGFKDPQGRTVAVVPFASYTDSSQGVGIAEYLVVRFQNDARFTLVDRLAFQEACDELALSQSDMVAEEQALSVGKFLSAHYLVTGSVRRGLGFQMINATVIETETGRVVAAATVSVPGQELDSFAKQVLGEKGTIHAALFRSLLVPGWGQWYADKKIRGGIYLTLFLAGAGSTLYTGMRTARSAGMYNDFLARQRTSSGMQVLRSEYEDQGGDPSDQQAFNEYQTSRRQELFSAWKDDQGLLIGCAVATGALWLVNGVDALFAGAANKRKVRRYFGMVPGGPVGVGTYVFFGGE